MVSAGKQLLYDITDRQRDLEESISNLIANTIPADGLAAICSKMTSLL